VNIIDKAILEWSYKTTKGYPDINSQEDMALFESMFGFNLNEGDFNILSFGDLKKYGGPRLNKLYTLIDAGTAIELASGKEEPITFAKPEYADLFKNSDIGAIKQLGGSRVNTFPFFIDNNKKPLNINGLLKSVPFGGKGKGTGTEKEDIALAGINQELNTSGPINVHVIGNTYKGITKAETVKGVPKADFTLNTENGPVVFLSHKDGSTAKDFQQYGGFKGLEEYKEVKAFVESVRTATNGELVGKQSFKRALLSEEVKRKAVYGLGFGDKEFHNNNCQAILQGPVKFEAQESGDYTITSNHQVSNPDIPSGLYEPMLYVTFRSDRNNMGIKNARFGIYPADYKPNATDI
jgi:hypothetical protein